MTVDGGGKGWDGVSGHPEDGNVEPRRGGVVGATDALRIGGANDAGTQALSGTAWVLMSRAGTGGRTRRGESFLREASSTGV